MADRESRRGQTAGDLRLADAAFNIISNNWTIKTDLFASAWNARCQRFVSWLPQPGAWKIDALSISWKDLHGYAFPPFNDPELLNETNAGPVDGGSDQHLLAKSILVPDDTGTGCGHPAGAETIARPATVEHGLISSANGIRIGPTHRLEVIRGSLSQQGLPDDVITLLLAGNRSSTHTTYQAAWNVWCDWNVQKHQDPMCGNLIYVLQFLAESFNKGRSYSTINIYRSMISSTLSTTVPGLGELGNHPQVNKLMKGTYNLRPPTPRYNSTWDPVTVINFLRNISNNSDILVLSKKLGNDSLPNHYATLRRACLD